MRGSKVTMGAGGAAGRGGRSTLYLSGGKKFVSLFAMGEVSLSGSFLSSLLFKLKNASGDTVNIPINVHLSVRCSEFPGRVLTWEGVQSQSRQYHRFTISWTEGGEKDMSPLFYLL